MNQDPPRRYRKPLPGNLAWTAALMFVLFMVYVLSYPLALQWRTAGRALPAEMRAYAPVEAAICRSEIAFNAMCTWSRCVDAESLVIVRVANCVE
jgi:hypothetical protein